MVDIRDVKRIVIGGQEMADVRHMFPPTRQLRRTKEQVTLFAVHHDAVVMLAGDKDFNGSTLDEDLERLEALFNNMPYGRFAYHFMASPNGRAFYTLDLNLIGAHLHNLNTPSVGGAFMGDLSRRPPTNAAICAMGVIEAAVFRWRGENLSVRAHRAFPGQSTICPGDTRDYWWPKMLQAFGYHLTKDIAAA